jgi:hypothetical protein
MPVMSRTQKNVSAGRAIEDRGGAMKQRAIRRCCIGVFPLVFALVATQGAGRAQRRDPSDWAANHMPIAAIALYNGSYAADDPWGLQECWRQGSREALNRCGGRGGVNWLVTELERRRRLGYRRFMLTLPAGRASGLARGQGWPSAQWHLLDTAGIETLPSSKSVRRDLATLLTPWLAEHKDVQLLIYQGLRFNPNLPEPWKDRDMSYSIAPDLNMAFHRKVVQENTIPWLQLTPRDPFSPRLWPWTDTPRIGFAFDSTSSESTREALVAVLNDDTLFGTDVRVFISGEAIPQEPNPALPAPESDMHHRYIFRAPWFARLPFHQVHDPLGTWQAPYRTHLGFAVLNRETCASHRVPTCQFGAELTVEQIHDAIRSAHERGFVIFHYGGAHDEFILKLVGLANDTFSDLR